MSKTYLLAGALLVVSASVCACERIGQEASFDGSLRRQVFAGPPNYEDIRHGDAAERVFVFKLHAPACVTAPQGDHDTSQVTVRQVQLLDINQVLSKAWRDTCRRGCRVSGTLARADSGHHHLPVLMDVSRVEALASSPKGVRKAAPPTSQLASRPASLRHHSAP